MMLLPAAAALKTGRHPEAGLVTTDRLLGAVRPSRTARPSALGSRTTVARRRAAVKGSRTGARRLVGLRPAATASPMEGVCGAAAAQLLRGRRPRGPSGRAASPNLAAERTARPTRRTTGAAAAATRRRRWRFHPLFPPV